MLFQPETLFPATGTLKEQSDPKDQQWIAIKNKANDERLGQRLINFPSWDIVYGKKATVQFHPSTGNISILLERFPVKLPTTNLDNEYAKLTMDHMEWNDVRLYEYKIMEFLKALEVRRPSGVAEALALDRQENQIRLGKDSKNRSTFWFETNDHIRITLAWYAGSKIATIDIRRFELVEENGQQHMKPTKEGITLSARGYDFLVRFLTNKITNGIRMWTEMHVAGRHLLKACSSNYKAGSVPVMKRQEHFEAIEDEEEKLENPAFRPPPPTYSLFGDDY